MKQKFHILILAALCALAGINSSCSKEPATESSASFTIENANPAKAGEPVVINITGTGDYFSFFSGEPGHEYSNYPVDNGLSISKKFSYSYNAAGTYEITIVSSSWGNWGDEQLLDVKKQTITVIDNRADFTEFGLKEPAVSATIDRDNNQIKFLLSDAQSLTNLIPVFYTNSPQAKVTVDGVEQVSNSSVQNLSNPVNYLITAVDGTQKQYTVIVNTFPADSNKTLLLFGMSSPDKVANIDQDEKSITLSVPFGSNLKKVKIYGSSSPKSSIYIGTKLITSTPKTIDISAQPTIVKVVAENSTFTNYSLTTSLENPFSSFSFAGLNPAPPTEINHVNHTIDIYVLEGTNITNLVAIFTGNENATTKIGNTVQVSGTTTNDFSSPLVYSVAGLVDPTVLNYTVTVHVLGN